MGSVDTLTDFYLAEGVNGMTILGVMGEAPKLTNSEQIALLDRYLKRINGRVPVVVGVSNPGIDNVVSYQRRLDAGADGVMVAGIPGLRTDEHILAYFEKLFHKLDDGTPVCLRIIPLQQRFIFLLLSLTN